MLRSAPNDVAQHEISEYFSITALGMNLQATLLRTTAVFYELLFRVMKGKR